MDLNQVTIPSSDLNRSVAFYQSLGLKLIVDSIPRYARFECPVGDATFSIHHSDEPVKCGGAWLYFEVEDIDNFILTLKEKGIRMDTMPETKNWLWREAHLTDPDGHHLVIYHAGVNRKNPPWRLL